MVHLTMPLKHLQTISQAGSAMFTRRIYHVKYLQICLVLVCCHGNELKLRERGHFTNVPLLPSNETFVTRFLIENIFGKAWINLS